MLLNLVNVRIKDLVRELVLFNHLSEAFNVATSMEHDKALFESFNLFSHEVDQYFKNYFLRLGHLLGSLRVHATFR